MNKLSHLLFLGLLGLAQPVFGQSKKFSPGYVVMAQGDTMRGEIGLRSAYKPGTVLVFRNASGEVLELPPNKISAFVAGDRFYYSSLATKEDQPDHREFALEIVNGPASLYQGFDSNDDKVFYVKNKGRVVELKKRFLAGLLKIALPDCPSLVFEALPGQKNAIAYTISSLRETVSAYNRCAHPNEATIIRARQDSLVVRFGAKVGAGQTTLRLLASYFDRADWQNTYIDRNPSLSLMGGVAVNFSRPSSRFSAQAELLFARQSAEFVYGGDPNVVQNYRTVATYQMTTLIAPLLFKYAFRQPGNGPFVYLGVAPSFAVPSSARQPGTNSNTYLDDRVRPIIVLLSAQGSETAALLGTGGVGWAFPLGKRTLELEFRADHSITDKVSYRTAGSAVRGHTSTVQLMATYCWR